MTEAGPDYRWLLFSIGSSWFGIWAITGFHQIRGITYVMISLWGSDLPILPLMISVVGPVVIALSMIPLAFERTKMIGYGLALISCMILVGRNIHRDGTAALALWEATHEPFNILWSIAACAPHFAMIAICLCQLRRPLARYGEKALGLIFVSAHAIP
jgi:hypothetical protein